MPRLSLWKSQKSNDYRFFDRTISEMFTVGATDMYVHKYIGTNNPITTEDATLPHYDQLDPTNIQDLLFLENRDRKYDSNVYRLRGHYNVQNLDFDLSQFGLFLTNDIIFVTVHYNDMIDVIGRKLMVGDVFELPHLTDYHPLNETIPIGLRRYYQITDANFASEGFSQTWYPHLWRIKCEPLTNSQEFANILQQPINKDNYLGDWDPTKTYEPGYTITFNGKIYTPKIPVPAGTDPTNTTYWQLSTEQNLIDIISTYNKNIEINEAVIEEAKRQLPKSGYDVSQLYVVPTYSDNEPAPPVDVVISNDGPNFPFATLMMYGQNKNIPSLVFPKKTKALTSGQSISLQLGIKKPTLTDTGSGPVAGDPVISAFTIGNIGNVPYGTSDNTFIFADQYPKLTITATNTEVKSNFINLLEEPSQTYVGLKLTCTVVSENGTIISVFPQNTAVTGVNIGSKTIFVNNPAESFIPSGTKIILAVDFNGEVSPESTYRADWDPRFTFIRRVSPTSFGWLAGYNTGDGTAPNGEPLVAATNFPSNPKSGDYCLRLDYFPQKLFRFNGKLWVEISRNVRTDTGLVSTDKSQLSSFINNDATVTTTDGSTIPSRQSLRDAFRIQSD